MRQKESTIDATERGNTHWHSYFSKRMVQTHAPRSWHWTQFLLDQFTLCSYLHPPLAICDSPSHQIFTVGPIKHSLCSTATFICPPPSSLQLVHQKPTKSLKTCTQAAYIVGNVATWCNRGEEEEIGQNSGQNGE